MKVRKIAALAFALASLSAQAAPQWQDHYYPTPTQGSMPWTIVRAPNGILWFTEYAAGNLGRLDPATGVIQEFPIPTASSAPMGLTFGPDGNLWFTEQQGNNIGRYTIATGTFDEFPIPTASAYPYSISAGPDGNLWFTESSPQMQAKVAKITTAGVITEYPLSDGGADPTGITSGPDGNVWFAEQFPYYCGGDTTPPPARVATMTASGTITEFQLPACHYPLHIVTGGDGSLWFTEQINGQVGRVTTGGTISEFDIPNVGAMATPFAIAAGSDGNVWFSENTNNTLDIVTSSGTVSVILPLTLQNASVSGLTEGPNPFNSSIAMWFTANDNIGVVYDASASGGGSTDASDTVFDNSFDSAND